MIVPLLIHGMLTRLGDRELSSGDGELQATPTRMLHCITAAVQ
jgi:hypothetical protein